MSFNARLVGRIQCQKGTKYIEPSMNYQIYLNHLKFPEEILEIKIYITLKLIEVIS